MIGWRYIVQIDGIRVIDTTVIQHSKRDFHNPRSIPTQLLYTFQHGILFRVYGKQRNHQSLGHTTGNVIERTIGEVFTRDLEQGRESGLVSIDGSADLVCDLTPTHLIISSAVT